MEDTSVITGKMRMLFLLITFHSGVNLHGQDHELLKKMIHQMGIEDQKYRLQIDSVEKTFGIRSVQLKELSKTIQQKDSMHMSFVSSILDRYGWPGPEEIGQEACYDLFFIVLHFNDQTHKKYLGLIREAVKAGKLRSQELALLEDRVALADSGRQIYGSQIRKDQSTGEYYLAPLADPCEVDMKRKEMGMIPLSEFLQQYNISWDPENYVARE